MIREATAADGERIAALQRAELASPAPELLDLAFETDAATVLVSVAHGDELRGYALALPGDPDAGPSTVYVAELVVRPGARRRGHGAALLDAAAERFAAFDQLRLTARASDDAALAFYRENGFEVAAERPGRYEDDDGVLLLRDL